MMLRYFPDDELKELLNGWKIDELKTLDSGSQIRCCSHLRAPSYVVALR